MSLLSELSLVTRVGRASLNLTGKTLPTLRAAAPPPTTRPGRLPRSPLSRGLVSLTTHGQTSGVSSHHRGARTAEACGQRSTAQAYTAPGDQPAGQHRATRSGWEPVSPQRDQNAEAAHKGANGTGGPRWPGSGGAPPLYSSRRPASPAQEGTRWLPWGSGGVGCSRPPRTPVALLAQAESTCG